MMSVSKDIKDIGNEAMSILQVGIGVLPVVVGGIMGGTIGAGLGTFVGEKYLCKGTTNKNILDNHL